MKCSKCGQLLTLQVDSPFLRSYACGKCGAAYHEVKDERYPFKAMVNKKRLKRWL